MSEQIKEGDFVQVEYNGYIAEDNALFDTTDEQAAQKHGIHRKNAKYGPTTICIGQHQLIKGLDRELVGKSVGQRYTFTFPPDEAFGKKNGKLLQLIQTAKFTKEGIQPMPGLQITADGMLGMIKSVSGGRTLVDFNHPLSGRDVRYEVTVIKKVAAAQDKLSAYVEQTLQIPDAQVIVKEEKATVTTKIEVPTEIIEQYTKKVQEVIPEIKSIIFTKPKAQKEEKA